MRHFKGVRILLLLVLITASIASRSLTQTPVSAPVADPEVQHAALAVQTLQAWYDLDTGLYKTTGWWNSANAITALADYASVAQSRDYDFVFSNTLSLAQRTSPGFINRYYDDEGWWALAWIDAYSITRDKRYLDAAKFIFIDLLRRHLVEQRSQLQERHRQRALSLCRRRANQRHQRCA